MWTKLSACLLALSFLIPATVQAQSDDYDVIAIKKKYFLKAKRHEFGLNVGVIPNDSFSTGVPLGGHWGYHLSESFALELSGGYNISFNTDATNTLENNFGITPSIDELNYYGELHAAWSPIYGKLSFLTKKIIYFDMSFYAGGGVSDLSMTGLNPHLTFGISPRFVLNKWMALRFDIKDNVIIRTSPGTRNTIKQVLFVMAGLHFFFPIR